LQFLTGLFGDTGSILTAVFALGVVLVLIVLGVWLLKFVFNVSGNAARGRNRRLSVVDTLALDQKRQLVIIRRDDTEHLILTGGPQDVVIETGIPVVEVPAPQPVRRPPMVGARRQAPPAPAAPAPQPVAPAAKPAAPRSLRHTGLLRPVTTQDPTVTGHNPDISAEPKPDSAKEGGTAPASEGTALDHDPGTEANRH
jgi:flagellar protein FliO/FliZ